jgi:ribosome-binding factor A
MSSRRSERVAEAVREAIAEVITRELKDPRVGLVAITRVEMSPDLRHARVHFSCLGDAAARDRCAQGLRSATGFIRGQMLRRLDLRVAPDLAFFPDASLEAAARLNALLRQISPPDEPTER